MSEKISLNKLKNKYLFSIILLSLYLFISGCSSVQKTQNTNTLFVNDSKLITETLPNGFSYILMKNKKPVDRVSMHLVIQSGSMNETDEQRGLAHYLEHMLFNGTEHFPPGELIKFFQSIGMNFGGDANAHTGFYETVYDIVLPKGNEEKLGEGLLVMKDYAGGALLLESEIEREKNIILAEKRDRDSASYRMFESTLKFELGDMKIPQRLPIGTVKTIQSANKNLLKDYYDTWYSPSNMVLVVVGDFQTKNVQQMIKEKFSTLKARASEANKYNPGKVNHTGIKTYYHFEKEIGKTSVTIETVDDTPRVKDSLAERKKEVISRLANSILQNRLDVLTSKPDAPFTSASTSSGTYLRNVKYSDISADCSPEKWEKALLVIEQSLRAALKYGFYEQELNRARDNYISALKRGFMEAGTRDSTLLARQITNTITNDKFFLSPENNLKIFEPFLKSLKLKDINESIQKAWSASHRLVIVNGNVDLLKQNIDAEQKIKAVYMESFNAPVKKPGQEKEVTFPYLPIPTKKGKIVKKVENKNFDIIKIEFENGVKLNLKKTDFKANQVLYKVIFGGGKKNEPVDKPGLASLSSNLINESGFGSLDNDELKRALTGKNTSLTFQTGIDNFIISGRSVPEENKLMMQLIRTQLLDPGFRKDVYSLIMERMKQKYQKMQSTIDGSNLLYATKFLAKNDSRFGLPSYEAYSSISIDDVKNWAGTAIKSDNIEISIVGDFSIDSMIEACALYLGSLPKDRKPFTENEVNRTNPVFPTGEELKLSVKTKVPKSLVKVAYKTDDFWDIKRTRRLAALAAVFSDRLRNTIREELGAAYSPYAYNKSSIAYTNYGVFQAVISIKPGQEKIVIDKVKDIARQLTDKKIGLDELKRSIDPIITQIKDLQETNNYWLNSVLSGSLRYPEKLKWAKTIESDYQSITTDDILFYAKKYLNNDVAAAITITTEQ